MARRDGIEPHKRRKIGKTTSRAQATEPATTDCWEKRRVTAAGKRLKVHSEGSACCPRRPPCLCPSKEVRLPPAEGVGAAAKRSTGTPAVVVESSAASLARTQHAERAICPALTSEPASSQGSAGGCNGHGNRCRAPSTAPATLREPPHKARPEHRKRPRTRTTLTGKLQLPRSPHYTFPSAGARTPRNHSRAWNS